MLELRFTQEKLNKIQNHLNKLGQFKQDQGEDFKIFVDRFKKLIGDVRSIDPKQVPSELNLMGVLKEALSGNEILWGHLTLAKDITLPVMMDTVAKWKSSKSQKSAAVANYTDLSGNLKKAYGKKQSSGRGSGKDQVARRVETKACLACEKVGHLVKDCRNKAAKDAWIAKREQKQDKRSDDSRGRKHVRNSDERSDSRHHSRDRSRSNSRDRDEDRSRDRSRSRERSGSRDRGDWRENNKKKSISKSITNWMNSDGEQTEDESDNSYPCFEFIDYIDGVRVELKGAKIGHAFSARMKPDMVCIDSGSNRLVLIEKSGIIDYALTPGRTLGTINSPRRCTDG